MSSIVSQIARLGRQTAARKKDPRKYSNYPTSNATNTTTPSRTAAEENESFKNGIGFSVQLIGSMDIQRPLSRVEIVAAMRRVRFEFKAKGIKKRKVRLVVSVDGVFSLVRRKAKPDGQSEEFVLKSHPIYRIFYVSHDSQDVKIFSYIAREATQFHCCVFKAKRKKQALRIVRTIGQAFEVCHKLSPTPTQGRDDEEGVGEEESLLSDALVETNAGAPSGQLPSSADTTSSLRKSKKGKKKGALSEPTPAAVVGNVTTQYDVSLLKSQLEQNALEKASLQAQINLLKDQLLVESSARIEAQNRTQQLLAHNKELLDHLQMLVGHIHELEGNGKDVLETSLPPTRLLKPHVNINEEVEKLRLESVAHTLDTILHEKNKRSPGTTPTKREVNFDFNVEKPSKGILNRSVSEKMPKQQLELELGNKSWSRHTTK